MAVPITAHTTPVNGHHTLSLWKNRALTRTDPSAPSATTFRQIRSLRANTGGSPRRFILRTVRFRQNNQPMGKS